MRSKALRGLYVLRRQLRAAKTGRSNSAVIVKNHGTASIGARSHGGGIEAHAPQEEPHNNTRGPDDARLRLRCEIQCLNQIVGLHVLVHPPH